MPLSQSSCTLLAHAQKSTDFLEVPLGMYYALKVMVTTLLIVAISEVSKRSSLVGAVLASVPLISVMAILWLYIDTKDVEKVSALAVSVFWLVLPSLVLFVMLPLLLKSGWGFYLSLGVSISATIVSYFIMLVVLKKLGIEL